MFSYNYEQCLRGVEWCEWTNVMQCNFDDFCTNKIHFNVEKPSVVSVCSNCILN